MFQDGINPQRKMLRTPPIRYQHAHVQVTALTIGRNMPMQMREKDETGDFHLHLGSSPGLGQEVYFWTHGTFPHTLSWGVVFWILTLVPICSYNISVPGSRNLEGFSCTRNNIWKGWILGTWSNTWLMHMVQRAHTGKHCFHAALCRSSESLLSFSFHRYAPWSFSSQVHRDPQPRMNFLFRNLVAFLAMEIFHPAELALAFFCHPDFITVWCTRHNWPKQTSQAQSQNSFSWLWPMCQRKWKKNYLNFCWFWQLVDVDTRINA